MTRYGTGRVYKPRNGRTLRIRYYDGLGRQVDEGTRYTSKNRQKAEQLLRKRLTDADAGKLPILGAKYDDLEQLIRDDYVANSRRVDVLERRLAPVAAKFRGLPAKSITTARLSAYRANRLRAGAAPATVNRELAALRRMLRLGQRAGMVTHGWHIDMLKEPPARAGFFEADQFEEVARRLPPHLEPIVRVAYMTGWRVRSELLTRQWRHVDLKARWLRLDPGETKNGEGRMFPLTADLVVLLKRLQRDTRAQERSLDRRIPWVFHRNGKPILSMYTAWRRACREAGLPGRLLHDFRRTAVRNLERAGVSRSAAMAMIGHRTESIYRRYSIVDETVLREAAEKLERSR